MNIFFTSIFFLILVCVAIEVFPSAGANETAIVAEDAVRSGDSYPNCIKIFNGVDFKG